MKNGLLSISLILACIASVLFCYAAAAPPRERLSLNSDWHFIKEDPPGTGDKLKYENIKPWVNATGAEFLAAAPASQRPAGNLGEDVAYTQPGFDDSAWRKLNLPHDWGIEGPFRQDYPGSTGKLPWWGIAWYRKHFQSPASDKGRQVFLDVDGAMAYANVWLNGQYVGGWPYGYASWRVDLTPYLKPGAENVLAIRLDNPPESSRWYPGGGIYRNVWLVKTSPVHVAHWGTYVTTPEVGSDAATVNVRVKVNNGTASDVNLSIKNDVYELDASGARGKKVTSVTSDRLNVAAHGNQSTESKVAVKRPRLWSVKTPERYLAVTSISQNGKLVDVYETPFGIRTIRFDAEKGFFLNGERVYLKGVCDHHDLGALGAAINIRALERQMEILKAMGGNAIRTSHNPPAPELLDVADRMGLVIMDEAFDCWQLTKQRRSQADYARLFPDWHEKDWRAQLRRDRNHPSVILWSTGNEVGEQGRPELHKISTELTAIAHEEDPTRPTTVGCNNLQSAFNGFQKTMDVFGYNYKPKEYGRAHDANPGLPIYGSETASCISSRGEYFFPVSEDKSDGRADFQMSSYDLYAPPWATPPDWEFKGQDEFPFVAGEFVWTGFDYLGEPTPYNRDMSILINFTDPAEKARAEKELKESGRVQTPSRSSYFGIVDLAGFPKDRYYIYQSRWRPELPMAHILPHWNWPERVGQVTPVHVYTSGDEAELFLNGQSLGRKKKGQYEYRLRWDDVVYQPGELKVVAYKDGKPWAEDVMKATGPATQLTMKPDRDRIRADGADLSFVTVTVADESGLLVPRSKNAIRFEVEGPGEIVATDNGDPTSFESFQAPERKAFNGLALVIVRGQPGKVGMIKLTAKSDGLTSGSATIKVQ
jgi:beta-galactosidase